MRCLVLLAAWTALGGCKGSQTHVLLVAHLHPSAQIDQLQLSPRSGSRVFTVARRPETAGAPLVDPQTVVLLLPDDVAGRELTVVVEGLRKGATAAWATVALTPVVGAGVTAEVWLGTAVDGGPDRHVDLRPRERGPDLPRQDAARDAAREPGTCTANAFLGCQGTVLSRCNATGSGVVTQSCAPYLCNSLAGRCNACDPAAAPTCAGSAVVACGTDGLVKSVPCPLGCAAGVCCQDQDLDTVTTCAGDCDDSDPNVSPGQTAFFSAPTKGGGFDYNCDKSEEKEVSQVEACARAGASCQGNGWQNTVPACGVQGVFITCKPSGPTSCSKDLGAKVQSCR